MLSPIESLIVPIFFVLMGLQVKLEAVKQPSALCCWPWRSRRRP
jgi:Kef-type K+ transport system membrane component KefB